MLTVILIAAAIMAIAVIGCVIATKENDDE